MGQGNQERFDLYAGKVGGQRENALQNGPTLNQAVSYTHLTLPTILLV